jgi:hypothetical protein
MSPPLFSRLRKVFAMRRRSQVDPSRREFLTLLALALLLLLANYALVASAKEAPPGVTHHVIDAEGDVLR